MVVKVLLINFYIKNLDTISSKVDVSWVSFENLPPLHDYHAVIIDVDDFLSETWSTTSTRSNAIVVRNMKRISKQLDEQTKTGGWAFILNGSISAKNMKTGYDEYESVRSDLWLPPNIKLVSQGGNTFYVNPPEIRYYSNLFDGVEDKEISWKYYVSEYPENSRVIASNRANYSVFIEVPNGLGRYVLLPKFKYRDVAVHQIIHKIIPQVIQEEASYPIPDWIKNVEHPLEVQARSLLSDIYNARKILYTRDRELVRASKRILEKFGFDVELLPKGTYPDLRIKFGNETGIIEVKGHINRQENRRNVSKLFGYLSDTDITEKGIFIANHEFSKPPEERSEEAYTFGAIDLAEKNEWALLSSIDLWTLFLLRLENKLSDNDLADLRNIILTGKGLIKFSILDSS